MESPGTGHITRLLNQAAAGNQVAAGELFLVVNGTLRKIARQKMSGERRDHILQTTALVHEAWIKLVGGEPIDWTSRRQFYATAAEAMRCILVDYARQRGAKKRGAQFKRAAINIEDLAMRADPDEILALVDAITDLANEEPDLAVVVRMRFFLGLTIDETASVLGKSPRQVDRLWFYARARLFRLLKPDA